MEQQTMKIDKLKKGIEFEDYIYDWLLKNKYISCKKNPLHEQKYGENSQGIEIKNDQKFNITGNLFISIKRQYGSNDVDWGIFKKDNTWLYIIGDQNKHWIFLRKQLINYFETKQPYIVRAKIENGYEFGFLLKTTQADMLGEYYPNNQTKLKL